MSSLPTSIKWVKNLHVFIHRTNTLHLSVQCSDYYKISKPSSFLESQLIETRVYSIMLNAREKYRRSEQWEIEFSVWAKAVLSQSFILDGNKHGNMISVPESLAKTKDFSLLEFGH